ncbi:hypothetical protein OS189_15455 [Sulfitobacter sp. F26169L]|uniref:hypothetical protein n=1 Tax=Sulfitobacter sp. F26169L TaxID=2996015 RepID=UPI002260F01A|nr:hypothetical protein [Sulfitobacter sp. F26169L]MCX7567741.1 hypothetical protein [Sulfitobacter sp. F26169L]
MTNYNITTQVAALKADCSNYPTSLANAFAALLPALARHIEAEREIEEVDIWNPAFRAWLTDAEEAFADVTTHLSTIASLELTCDHDKPLKRMSLLLTNLIGSEEPDTFVYLYSLRPHFEDLFQCEGSSPAVRHRNVMLGQALAHIDAMATLLTYDGYDEVEVDDSIDPPALT